MNVFRIQWWDLADGNCYAWAATKGEVHQQKQRIRAHTGRKPEFDVEVVEIPTTKAELVAWLNAHFTTDNG